MTQRQEPSIALSGQMRRPTSASPGIRLYYRISCQDAQGRTYRKGRQRRSHSYLKQFVQILWAHMYYTESQTLLDTSNAAQYLDATPPAGAVFRADGGIGGETMGPVIGTGSTAVVVTDYALGTRIVHGVGAGQLEYGATTHSTPAVAGTTASFTISRPFTNSSGASVTVYEIGLYVYSKLTGAGSATICIARDIVTATAIPHGESRTVEYTIKVTA